MKFSLSLGTIESVRCLREFDLAAKRKATKSDRAFSVDVRLCLFFIVDLWEKICLFIDRDKVSQRDRLTLLSLSAVACWIRQISPIRLHFLSISSIDRLETKRNDEFFLVQTAKSSEAKSFVCFSLKTNSFLDENKQILFFLLNKYSEKSEKKRKLIS